MGADPRDPKRIKHGLPDMLRQRVFGLVQGYEDLSDHATLRNDVLMQTACERDTALASPPALCRLPAGPVISGVADRPVARTVQGGASRLGTGRLHPQSCARSETQHEWIELPSFYVDR